MICDGSCVDLKISGAGVDDIKFQWWAEPNDGWAPLGEIFWRLWSVAKNEPEEDEVDEG
jgi:hypothetical protein